MNEPGHDTGAAASPRGEPAGELAALINPLSFRMSLKQRAKRSADRVRAHGGRVFEVTNLGEIEAALSEAMRKSVRRLVIAGGDGTLQGTVSWLARRLDSADLPELIVLSAGRTNYVAGDIGARRHFPDTLETILTTAPDRLHPVDRATLHLRHPSLDQQHGFFMAAAVIDEIIRYVHRWQAERENWWRRRHAASTLGVLSLAWRRATGRYRSSPPTLEIETDPLGRLAGPCRYLMATTLTHADSIVDPYAGGGHGPLRLTAVSDRAAHRKRWLPALATGRFHKDMKPENGYLSGFCENILIHGLANITLDGQEFDLDPGSPLSVRPGPVFRFLRP
ncbi:MAG: diacylglycerol kinase family protein [Candidatus Wenzhouxiangella sp. M2_3B_020]